MNNKENLVFCLFIFYFSVLSCRETFTLKIEVFLPMGKPLISNFIFDNKFFLYKIHTWMGLQNLDPQSLRLRTVFTSEASDDQRRLE